MTEGKEEVITKHDDSQSAIIKQREAPKSGEGLTGAIRSKYENAFGNKPAGGHSTVWGSYWHKIGGWGYNCCYSFDKNSKCLGESFKTTNIQKIESEHKKLTTKKRSRSREASSDSNNKR